MVDAEKLFYYSFLLVSLSLLTSGIVVMLTLFPSNTQLVPSLGWILSIVQILAGIFALIATIKLFREFG